jgi:sec-independent protein translocase protein TatA
MPTLGPLELVIILVIVAMLFGVGKLPEVFGAVGKGVREFRTNAQADPEESSEKATAEVEQKDSAPAATTAESEPTKTAETTQTT